MTRWSGRVVTTARAHWRARLAVHPLPCYRCRKPVTLAHTWTVEHVVERARGGSVTDPSNQWVAHARCNFRAGGKLGAAKTNARRRGAPSPTPALKPETERGIRGW